MKEVKVTFGNSLEGICQGAAERGLVLISPGAGGSMQTPLLLQTAERLADLGFFSMRWNFGYITAKKTPSAGGKRELPEMAQAIDYLRSRAERAPMILIGKSFGGRLSSYVGSERRDLSGFVFYGLPLQGLGKNPRPRDWSHLAKLPGKLLFVTGDKDRLCPLDQLLQAQTFIKVPFDSIVVPGDHSFKPRGEEEALKSCVEWLDKNF
jgi:predicted alpha/beta-hydrolase family hydrolase